MSHPLNFPQRSAYCVISERSCQAQTAVRLWIAAREKEGWTVEFRIREDNGRPAVMWQCITHKDGKHLCMEFTPMIGMDGIEGAMN